MTYSSAIFAEPISADEPLEAAQERKVRLLLDRLDLKPGQRLLEIGCGWGGLAEIAARDYGVQVTGLTLSDEQKAYADGRLADAGLADRVDIAARPTIATSPGSSTRSPASRWSRRSARNIGRPISRRIARVLKPGGRAALQLISIRDDLFDRYAANADFIQTYIFPGGMLIGEARFRAHRRGGRPRLAGPRRASASIMPRR